jgi:hypothetical protein
MIRVRRVASRRPFARVYEIEFAPSATTPATERLTRRRAVRSCRGLAEERGSGSRLCHAAAVSRDVLAALKGAIDSDLHPALKAEGFRRRGDVWTEGDAASGWRLVNVQRSRYNTREKAKFTINTSVWPAGTVEIQEEVLHQGWGPSPTGNAPFHARPAEVAPDAYGGGGPRRWWRRGQSSGQLDAWWSIGRWTDFSKLGRELASFCVDRAVPWARERSQAEVAAAALIERGHVWDLVYALAILERAGISDARFAGDARARARALARVTRPRAKMRGVSRAVQLVTAALAAAALAGCGSGDASEPGATRPEARPPQTISKAEFVERVDAACRRTNERSSDLRAVERELPPSVIRTTARGDALRLAKELRGYRALVQGVLDELKREPRPPGADRGVLRQFEIALSHALIDLEGDETVLRQQFDRVLHVQQVRNLLRRGRRLAGRYGFEDCARLKTPL